MILLKYFSVFRGKPLLHFFCQSHKTGKSIVYSILLQSEAGVSKMFLQDVYTVQVYENAETPLTLLNLDRELVNGLQGVHFRLVHALFLTFFHL